MSTGTPHQGTGFRPCYSLSTLKRLETGQAQAEGSELDQLRRLSETLMYANDTDCFRFCQEYLDEVTEVLVPLFRDEYNLIVNADKTKQHKVGHLDMPGRRALIGTRKLYRVSFGCSRGCGSTHPAS